MTIRVIRYRTKPDRAEENQALIEKVFNELVNKRPGALSYQSLRLADDTFVHIVEISGADALEGIEAFSEFQADIADRCVEAPVALSGEVVGRYEGDGAA